MNSEILNFGSDRQPQYVSAADLSWLFGGEPPSGSQPVPALAAALMARRLANAAPLSPARPQMASRLPADVPLPPARPADLAPIDAEPGAPSPTSAVTSNAGVQHTADWSSVANGLPEARRQSSAPPSVLTSPPPAAAPTPAYDPLASVRVPATPSVAYDPLSGISAAPYAPFAALRNAQSASQAAPNSDFLAAASSIPTGAVSLANAAPSSADLLARAGSIPVSAVPGSVPAQPDLLARAATIPTSLPPAAAPSSPGNPFAVIPSAQAAQQGPWNDYAAQQGPWNDFAPQGKPTAAQPNPFDQFDAKPAGNFWDADAAAAKAGPAGNFWDADAANAAPWNAATEATNAAMFGLGPNVNAAIEAYAPTWAGGNPAAPNYRDALAQWNAAKSNYETAYPWRSFAANAAGGSLPYALLPGGLMARVLGSGVIGAAQAGAPVAANTDGSLPDRAAAAALPALAGAGGAVAAIPIGKAIGAGVGSVAQRLGNALFNRMNGAGLTAGAADALNGALARQGQTPAAAIAAARDLGPGATLADTGQATQELAARLAARDPNVAPTIAQNLTDRAGQLAPRINQIVDAAVGPDFDATAKLNALKAATAANGKANYSGAFSNPAAVDVTPVLEKIDEQIAPGVTKLTGSGVNLDPISAALRLARGYISRDGSQAANIQTLHRSQDVIDDMASSAFRAGDNAKARALWGIRSALLDQMDAANPAYGAARSEYASDKAIEEAFQEGRNVLAARSQGQVFDPDLLKVRLANMAQPEQDAYRLGARKALSDVMGQARSDPAGLAAKLANEDGYAADKLRAVFGADKVQPILEDLDKQGTIRQTNNLALGGSKTAMATAADDLIPTAKLAGNVGHGGMGGGLWSAVPGALLGREIGEAFGAPGVGAGVGAGAGLAWNAGVAPIINAGRVAGQNASRMALAKALTGEPADVLAAALAKRQGYQKVPPLIAEQTKRLVQALTRQGIASTPAAQRYIGAQ